MTERLAHARARCSGCNRVYRVPDPGRTYTCKACGGTVRAEGGHDEPGGRVIEGTVTCSECKAVNPGGLHFCAECGTSLDYSKARPGNHAAARLRQEANEALERANRWIGGVTAMYFLGAAAYAAATLFAVLALTRADVPLGAGVLVVGLTTLLSVLLLTGAIHILFKPFVWAIAIACLATAVSVVHLVGPNPLGVAFIASATLAVFAWAAIVPTLRFRRLIAKHKDLYILHHASLATRRSLKGKTAHERHERLLRAMRRAARRAWKVSAVAACAIVLASSLGTYTVLAHARPRELEPAIERFETAWGHADLATLGDCFDERVRDAESAQLAAKLAGLGWRRKLPSLGERRTAQEGEDVRVDYTLGDVVLSTRWIRIGTGWTLAHVDLPFPPLEPVFEKFVTAWRASDPAAMAAFFAPDARAKMVESIESSAKSRGWDAFPEVRKTTLGDESRGETTGTLVLDRGEVTTDWNFGAEGRWRLHGLHFPKR